MKSASVLGFVTYQLNEMLQSYQFQFTLSSILYYHIQLFYFCINLLNLFLNQLPFEIDLKHHFQKNQTLQLVQKLLKQKMSQKNPNQSEEMYKKLVKISKDNKKVLESLSSHLILQSSYLDRYIKQESYTNGFLLQEKYEQLLTQSNQSMQKNEILHNQLQQKRNYIQSLKEQIDKYQLQNIKLDHQMTHSERKLMQEEELQKQYQFELMKKNAELKKELDKAEDTQKSLIQQNSLYERESMQLHTALDNANHQLKQSEFVFSKKQEEQRDLITELEDLKRQMMRKKQKLVKRNLQLSQPKQKNDKNQVIREIGEIQYLIANYKRNKQSKNIS